MKDQKGKPNRRSIRLREYDYSQAGGYFVTICTTNRECLFGEIRNGKMVLNELGTVVQNSYRRLFSQYSYISPDAFVVMPNHFHGILVIGDDCRGGSRTAPTRKPLGRLIGAFKTVSTKQINQFRGTPSSPVWQRNYYEHIIRNEIDLGEIREYIQNNPSKWLEDENHPTNLKRS